MRNRPVYDVVALLARCGVGAVFLAHGWQKIQVGVTATGRSFDAMGVPIPTAAAVYSTFVELLAGAALIVGVALPVAGILLFLDMAGAFVFVNAEHGIFLVDGGAVRGGFELVLVLGLASLVFAAGGAGRITLDHRLFGPGGGTGRGAGAAARPAVPRATGATAPSSGMDEPAAGGKGATRPLAPPSSAGEGGRSAGGSGRGTGGTGSAADPGQAAPTGGGEPAGRARRGGRRTGGAQDVLVAGEKTAPSADDDTAPRKGTKGQKA